LLGCRDTVDELRTAHPDRRIELEMRGDCWGEWDCDRLAQVVVNLVTNALDHGDPEAPVRVRIAGEAAGDVRVEVHNQGEPIAAEDLPFLFDPLRGGRRPRERSSRNLGLGLYIVDEIVRSHRGSIEVASTAEAGTTISVRLPRGPQLV
jgi:signal transduction histidine kinase